MTGACVLLFNDRKQLLLQKRLDNGLWALPGGSMEPGDTLEETAKRELFEETGYSALELDMFHVFSGEAFYYQYPHGDEVYNVVAAYTCDKYEGTPAIDRVEVQDLRFFDLDALPKDLCGPDFLVIDYFLKERAEIGSKA